jgi:lipoate-protein ligase B
MTEQIEKQVREVGRPEMLLLELPATHYAEALEIQTRIITRKISEGGPDVLIVVEHPPTITLGIRGKRSHLLVSEQELADRGISLFTTDRGGELTYHGPGQLVVYPIMDLKSQRLSARQFVQRLEETLVRAMDILGLPVVRRTGAPGIWLDEKRKIASIGVRIHRHITSHGFSINVNLSENPSELIIVCGSPGTNMTSLSKILPSAVTVPTVSKIVVECFEKVFGVCLRRCSLQEVLASP